MTGLARIVVATFFGLLIFGVIIPVIANLAGASEIVISFGFYLIVAFASAITLAIWVYRINENARSMGAELSISPLLCSLFLFIPIINFLLAHFVFRQTAKVTRSIKHWKQQKAGAANWVAPLAFIIAVLERISMRMQAERIIDAHIYGRGSGEPEGGEVLLSVIIIVLSVLVSWSVAKFVTQATKNQQAQMASSQK